jgi:hypothetical protein
LVATGGGELAANVCRRNFQFLWNQADDMRIIRRALQLSTDKEDGAGGSRAETIKRPISMFVEDVIEWESRGERGDVYEVHYEPEGIADDHVNSVFCTVLLHLVDNAVFCGLNKLGKNDLLKIVVWVRQAGDRYETIVADSGKELPSDPLNEIVGSVEKGYGDHGSGLRICRILLGEFKGGIKWMPRDKFLCEYKQSGSAVLRGLSQCNTFFCFSIPKEGDIKL